MSRLTNHVPTISEYRARPAQPRRLQGGNRRFVHPCRTSDQPHDDLPLVTIVTPVRNAAATITRTLLSVLCQSYPNIEYIVVDGGSTDGTLDILRSFDRGIDYWLSEPDYGISDAFNKGIALASGDIIGILNADDWYELEAVQRAVDMLSRSDAQIVCGALQYWQDNTAGMVFYSNLDNLHLEATVNHPTVFVRRSVYEQYGLFDTNYRYAMDYDLLLRLYLNGVQFCVLPDVLANMQLGGASDAAVLPISRELCAIKTSHMGHPVRNMLYSAYHFLRTHLSKLLRNRGADRMLDAYRSRYSVVKKSRTSRTRRGTS